MANITHFSMFRWRGGGERSLSGFRMMLYLNDVSVLEQDLVSLDVLGVLVEVYE